MLSLILLALSEDLKPCSYVEMEAHAEKAHLLRNINCPDSLSLSSAHLLRNHRIVWPRVVLDSVTGISSGGNHSAPWIFTVHLNA